MRSIYSRITLTSSTELIGNRPPTHYRYHPLDDSRLIPIVSPEGRVTYMSIDAIAAIEILKASDDDRGVSGPQPAQREERMNLNDEDVAFGRNAFGTFARQAFGASPEQLVPGDDEDAFQDLLVALRHYAGATGLDFAGLDKRATELYELSLRAPNGAVCELHPAGRQDA